MIVLTFVDDSIIVGPSMVDIDAFIQSMKNGPNKFVWTDKGYIDTHIDKKIFKVS